MQRRPRAPRGHVGHRAVWGPPQAETCGRGRGDALGEGAGVCACARGRVGGAVVTSWARARVGAHAPAAAWWLYSRSRRADPCCPDSPVGGGGVTPGSDTGPHGQSQPPTPGSRLPARVCPVGPGDGGRGMGHSRESQGTLRCRFRGGRLHPGGADHVPSLGDTSAQRGHRRGARGSPSSLEGISQLGLPCGCHAHLSRDLGAGGQAKHACACGLWWPQTLRDSHLRRTLLVRSDWDPHAPQPGGCTGASGGLGQPHATPPGPRALRPITHPFAHQPGVSGGSCRPRGASGTLRRRGAGLGRVSRRRWEEAGGRRGEAAARRGQRQAPQRGGPGLGGHVAACAHPGHPGREQKRTGTRGEPRDRRTPPRRPSRAQVGMLGHREARGQGSQ